MIKKYKFHIITVAVIILAAAIMMTGGEGELEKELVEQEQVDWGNGNISPETGMNGDSDALYGVLEVSDNPELGNYKLVSELGEIYIRTSRDYGDLTGKQVRVSIDGIPESFRLIDIYANPQAR